MTGPPTPIRPAADLDPAATTPEQRRGWDIDADLTIHVEDGAGRRTTARLTHTGNVIELHAERPEVLLAAAGRRSGAMLAGPLATAGVRAELHGPHGRVATVDPQQASGIAALILGDRHLAVHPAGWAVLIGTVAARSWAAAVRPGPAVLLTAIAAVTTAVVCWQLCRAPETRT